NRLDRGAGGATPAHAAPGARPRRVAPLRGHRAGNGRDVRRELRDVAPPSMSIHRRAALAFTGAIVVAACGSFRPGRGAYEQTYLTASHNWTFRELYPETDRLFNGFDYGH